MYVLRVSIFRNLAILFITIACSFLVRCFIIYLFNLDLSQLSDFFFVGIIVSFIRPLITDLFHIYFSNIILLENTVNIKYTTNLYKNEFYSRIDSERVHGGIWVNEGSWGNDKSTTINGSKYKHITKRKMFWFLWKQHSDEFCSYKEFKNSWDVNTKIRSEIKKDIIFNLWSF